MYLRRNLLALCAAVVFAVGFCLCSSTAMAAAPHFAPGQIWSIKSTPPTTAKVVIVRIEPWHKRAVVHVELARSVQPGEQNDPSAIVQLYIIK